LKSLRCHPKGKLQDWGQS